MTKSTPTNPPAAENNIIVVDDRSLPGCDRALRLMQSNARAIVLQWSNCCRCSVMIITDLHYRFERRAGIIDAGYRMPVHTVDFEFIANQMVRVAHDHAICFRIQIGDVTRARGTARKSFPLSNCEQLDAVMLTEEISVDVITLAVRKFVLAQIRAQHRLLIVARS